jgi:hypothetical protein
VNIARSKTHVSPLDSAEAERLPRPAYALLERAAARFIRALHLLARDRRSVIAIE